MRKSFFKRAGMNTKIDLLNAISRLLHKSKCFLSDISANILKISQTNLLQREICIKLSDTVIKAYGIVNIQENSTLLERVELLNGLEVINYEVVYCDCCGSSEGGGTDVVSYDVFVDTVTDTIVLPVIPTDVLAVFRGSMHLVEGAVSSGYTVVGDTITLTEDVDITNIDGGEYFKILYS